ncbi:glycerol-3-phosphate 1-O-acyltransferase PlsY [Oceanithermus desulfurans]|uniref:Glycerol-3-phosphate acyltransferase n=2 Tax=Oceanithermus desulfurans TaxID=227924 RepID=A0A511RGP3_9DEIN|nr:glycerol-3-phosphate 1-O-acyltransferase PlsY [Oceanithermus desulfurans]MBB6028756.1 glycerol-3-phosphate acyltransferase PlsY [Oceanithermus desulfurans]GEM88815.1 glycerol-3-phosphate acyltransferase [Oceanithermus desulfurans NBRC 100063]
MSLYALVTLLLAYLFGSVPAGVLIARLYGVNIREVGSGNIGATNVLRALGWGPALVVFAFDMFKGGLAVLIARALGVDGWLLGGVALAAVLGQNFSVFLGFKGGKGVATSFGTVLFLDPEVALFGLIVALVVIALTRYVSAGSLTGTFAGLVYAAFAGRPPWELAALALLVALVFWTHRENVVRLQQGRERRLGEKADKKPRYP